MARSGPENSERLTVYLAARTARRGELAEAAGALSAHGVEVVSSWLDDEGAGTVRSDQGAAAVAARNLSDVRRCDVFVAFTEGEAAPSGRGGRHVELGVALACGKRVLLVGPAEHVFHRLPTVEHHDDLDSVLRALDCGP